MSRLPHLYKGGKKPLYKLQRDSRSTNFDSTRGDKMLIGLLATKSRQKNVKRKNLLPIGGRGLQTGNDEATLCKGGTP